MIVRIVGFDKPGIGVNTGLCKKKNQSSCSTGGSIFNVGWEKCS